MIPRIHFYEINDQEWWPQTLREKVQDYLTIGWTNRLPIIQPVAPCVLAARTLSKVLGSSISKYVYVDFASGSGGPTPHIERHLNAELRDKGEEEVQFVMSDISPHVNAWSRLTKKSENLSFIGQSVDATDAPSADSMLQHVPGTRGKKVMRLFSLAFHHFDDEMAAKVLENAVATSHGFCILELQARDVGSFVLVSLLWPLAMITAPFYFYNSPGHLFFTYLVPLLPFVWVFDGYISCLRTRSPVEVETLVRSKVPADELARWTFRSGEEMHTWPIGKLHWMIALKTDRP